MAENLEEFQDIDNLLDTPNIEGGGKDALDEQLMQGGDAELEGSLGNDKGGLDSFFEDLSTIDDLEDDPLPGALPREQAVPSRVQAPRKGKRRWRRRLLWLFLLGGLALVLYFYAWPRLERFLDDPLEMVAAWWSSLGEDEELLPDSFDRPEPSQALPITPLPVRPQVQQRKSTVSPKRVRRRPAKPVVQLPPLPAQLPRLIKPKPRIRPGAPTYGIQLAACLSQECIRNFTQLARRIGKPVKRRKRVGKQESIELVSRSFYQNREIASELASLINYENRFEGHASLRKASRGYQISMGFFDDLGRAKQIKEYLNQRFGTKGVFTTQLTRQKYDLHLISAGRFASKLDAQEALVILQTANRAYADAVVIQNPPNT